MAKSASVERWPREHGTKRTVQGLWNRFTLVLLVSLAVTALVPFFWMISTSLKTRSQVFVFPPLWIPPQIHWENYVTVFSAFPFAQYAANTAYITVTVTVFHTLTSAMAAYTFARLYFPGRDRIFVLYLGTLMIPGVVTLIPSYIMMTGKFLGWINTYASIIVPPSLGGVFSTFLLRQFMLTLPRELEDAATIDGSSPLQIFTAIVLPLSKSALSIVAVFTFMGQWNAFLWPLLMLSDPAKQTLTIGLGMMRGRWGTRWPELMAGTLMSMLPILVLLVLFQRYFEEGIVLTGLKG